MSISIGSGPTLVECTSILQISLAPVRHEGRSSHYVLDGIWDGCAW